MISITHKFIYNNFYHPQFTMISITHKFIYNDFYNPQIYLQ